MQIFSVFLPALILAAFASHATAAELDIYGALPATDPMQSQIAGATVELGLEAGSEPAYEGASDSVTTISSIIEIERLTIPGLIDIGGPEAVGLSLAPSFDFISERTSADHDWLAGLNDVDATYIPGLRVGYEIALGDGLSGEVYGTLQYAFGGSQDFLGNVGTNLSWRLTPQLTVTGGPSLSFAGDTYMDSYFGVTAAESAATGGRLAAYDPAGGLKSASLDLSVKYEFVEATFVTLKASYRQLLGSAADSPIVEQDTQFLVSAGLSRSFTFGY